MDAGTKQLADILNGNRVLEVPYYQRSYVWKEDQWSRFLCKHPLKGVVTK